MRYTIIFISVLLIFSACSEEKEKKPGNNQVQSEKLDCSSLDKLFEETQKAEEALENPEAEWSEIESHLNKVLNGIQTSIANDDGCNFIDHTHHSTKTRFDFVHSLTRRIETDNYPEGIRYLLKLQNLFEGDEEITEYFGEEIWEIAYKTPETYLAYHRAHPELQKKLIESTTWLPIGHQKMIRNFRELEGGEPLAKNLQKRYEAMQTKN